MVENVHSYEAQVMFKTMMDEILDSEGDDEVSKRVKIHEFISGLKRIGEESVNGVAMKASLGNNFHKRKIGPIIVKVPKNPADSSELVHEAVVGSSLSTLREKGIMCFSGVYTTFLAGAPLEGLQGQISMFDIPGETDVAYAVYESVNGAVPISHCEDPDELLFSVSYSVYGHRAAHTLVDYTHYDFHPGNVQMYDFRKYAGKKPLYFSIEDGIYLKSKGRFPMDIDYGMSHVVHKSPYDDNTMNYGIIDDHCGFSSQCIYPDASNPTSDYFKLFCFLVSEYNYDIYVLDRSIKKGKYGTKKVVGSLVSEMDNETKIKLLKNREECREIALKLLSYFFNEEVTLEKYSFIQGALFEKCRYHVPVQVANKYEWSMTGLLKHCLKLFSASGSDNVINYKPENVFGQQVKTSEEVLEQMVDEEVKLVNARDLYVYRNTQEYDEALKIFKENCDKSLEDDKSRINEIEKGLNFRGIVVECPMDRLDVNSIVRDLLSDNLDKLGRFIGTMSMYRDEISIIQYASEIDDSYSSLYERMKYTFNTQYKTVVSYINQIQINTDRLLLMLNRGNGDTDYETLNAREERRLKKQMIPFSILPLYYKSFNILGSYRALKSV